MNFEEACQILGVPVTSTREEIHAQYIYKAQLLHPDKTMGLPESVRIKAEEELKRINQAYNILKDLEGGPLNTPPRLSITPDSVVFKSMAAGSKKTATIHIDSSGGPYTNFWADDSPSPWLKVLEVRSTGSNPLPLEITLEASALSTLGKKARCTFMVRLENKDNSTRDEKAIPIELDIVQPRVAFPLRIFGPGLKKAADQSQAQTASSFYKWMPWLQTGVLMLAALIAGLVLNNISGMPVPLPLALVAAFIYSIEKWHRGLTTRFKVVGYLYKTIINLAILVFAGFLAWTGVQIYQQQLPAGNIGSIIILLLELLAFVYLCKIASNNSWRKPRLLSTFWLAALAVAALSFTGLEPLASYKASVIDFFISIYNRIAELINGTS